MVTKPLQQQQQQQQQEGRGGGGRWRGCGVVVVVVVGGGSESAGKISCRGSKIGGGMFFTPTHLLTRSVPPS